MSDTARANVDKFLSDNGMTFSAVNTGPQKRDEWECDGWRVTFKHQGTLAAPVAKGKADLTEDYYTGTGHRQPTRTPTNFPAPRGAKHQWVKPVAPHAADVLYSLIMDSSAADMSFNDWCDDYGQNRDSIKAFHTYQKCCATAESLRAFFGRDGVETLRTMLEDY